MALKQVSAILVSVVTALCGCARWSTKPSASYVTVEADSRHDTELARKDYNAARKCMEKYLKGKDCDFEKAEKLLQEALANDVRFGPAHHSLGVLYLWQKKLYLAAWEFEYAARLMPDRFEPLNNLGLVYESVGKYEQAMGFYLLAREKAPNNPEVIANLARASFRNGETVEQMRTVLEDILATDSRTEWRCWAAEKLGMDAATLPSMPANLPSIPKSTPAESPATPGQVEELPLLPPPSPDTERPVSISDEAMALPGFPDLFLSVKPDSGR